MSSALFLSIFFFCFLKPGLSASSNHQEEHQKVVQKTDNNVPQEEEKALKKLGPKELARIEEKYEKILYGEGITKPTKEEMRWARRLAIEMIDHEKTREERDDAIRERNQLANPYQLLQIRTAFERRIDSLYGPNGKPATKSYVLALEDALLGTQKVITTNPKIMEFRKMITVDGNIKELEKYLESAKVLYKELSQKAAHNPSGYILRAPDHNETEKIKSILEYGGIQPQPTYVSLISLSLIPIDLPPMNKNIGGEERACLMITPLQTRDIDEFKPKGSHDISKEDVLNMFPDPAIPKPIRVDWVLYLFNEANKIKRYCVQVKFKSARNATTASYNNHGYLKQFKVMLEPSGCYDISNTPNGVIEEMHLKEESSEKSKAATEKSEEANKKKR